MLGITEYYLVGFGFQGFHEGYELRFQNAPCKSYGAALSPTKFHAEFHEVPCEVHRAYSQTHPKGVEL